MTRGSFITPGVVADGQGVPLGVHLAAVSPAEVNLLEPTLATIAVLRWERYLEINRAFFHLTCLLITLNRL